ncbi:stress-response A/B barrel domain-containing protein UP3 isoform X2 [Cucumis melo var. makuwa]|uniref:Stress-response A/B barrel domain-containing protein UP3 isoform X2 n=1 Tax=Cucumis melo var. makuwa TaxID=1194695 RepID=A0A5D3CYP5_CUCMM|nr:stress-response A/B barrel domain-containing protein UP3 isoform X2 [Cucumis melo var. makuwa]
MLIQAYSQNPHFFFLPPNPSISPHLSFNVSHSPKLKSPVGRRYESMSRISASGEHNPTIILGKKRKVFEHISLLKAKENISEDEENDMLDYLYTTQYQMRGIVAVSLGEFLDVLVIKIMEGIPMVCICVSKGLVHVDYESEVEDDMLPIFRKGEISGGLKIMYFRVNLFDFGRGSITIFRERRALILKYRAGLGC